MSLLVSNMTYDQAVRAIREITLDVNPVPAFIVSGQGFSFSKNSSNVIIGADSYGIDSVPRIYDVVKLLRQKKVDIEFLPDYVPTEFTSGLLDFSYPDIEDDRLVEMENYFSTDTIEQVMVDFYAQYLTYTGNPTTVNTIFGRLDFMERRKLSYWVAYWLIDRRRMNAATMEQIQVMSGGKPATDFKNTTQEVTTTVGDVFRVTERVEDGGAAGEAGFTALWGDKYGYYTKLQLWLRDRFEKMFGDMSLREGNLQVSTFSLDKVWAPSTYNRGFAFSQYVKDIFLP